MFHDVRLLLPVHDDPSVRYFGLDWAAVAQRLEDLKTEVRRRG